MLESPDAVFAELVVPFLEQFNGAPITQRTATQMVAVGRQMEREISHRCDADFEVLIGYDDVSRVMMIGYRPRLEARIPEPLTYPRITGFQNLLTGKG